MRKKRGLVEMQGKHQAVDAVVTETRPVELFKHRQKAELANFVPAWKPGWGNAFERLTRR